MTNDFFVCFSCLLSSFFLPFKNLFEILDFEILALLGISGQIHEFIFFGFSVIPLQIPTAVVKL